MTKLRVLVLESERGAANDAVGLLEGAGHEVLRCHEPGAPAFPCKALAEHPDCPVRTGVVDVALTVRSRPRSQPAPHEDGVACALARHVPLVVAGSTALNPYEDWATTVLDRTDDVVAAVESAADAPLPRHAVRADAAARAVLATHGATGVSLRSEVRRRDGRLFVEMHGGDALDQQVRSVVSVRVIGALRDVDTDAGGVDVVFV